MAVEIDPEGVERGELMSAIVRDEARVLEVGSGDGRLSLRYAGAFRFVAGIDPKQDQCLSALKSCPSDIGSRLAFLCGSATWLPFRPESFEVVLFASTL